MTEFRERVLEDREFRRNALRVLGLKTFVWRSGLQVLDSSSYGVLLAVPPDSWWPFPVTPVPRLVVVRDVEGWHILQVPWWLWTAREAVAWSFGMPERRYVPSVEV